MSAAPYPTTLSKISNEFIFVTQSGHVYTVYFDTKTWSFPDDEIDRNTIYMGFSCHPQLKPFERNHDPRIGATIIWLVANMFREHKHSIITYVCSTSDGQARARLVTFGKWFNASPLKEKIRHIPKRIDNDNCFGIMFSKKHPNIEKIEFAFVDFEPENKFPPIMAEDPEGYYSDEDFSEEL